MPTAIGSEITTITIQSQAAGAQANLPVTFGQVFKEGDLPAGSGVELRAPDNSVVPCQLDARALHDDGSIRHAVLSAIIPALEASSSVQYSIVRKAAGAAPSPAAPSDFAGLDAVVTITQDGTDYSIALAPPLAGTKTTWLAGDIASEWEVAGIPKTSGNVEHAHLHVRFAVRAYKGQAKARIDITVENTWAWNQSPQDVPHDVVMTVGGAQAYAKTGIVHHPFARYRKLFWWNATAPAIHLKHNTAYLIASKAVPNYDQSVIPNLTQAATFKNATISNGGPMGCGTAQKAMPSTGGRSDIGILPGWAALYLISMNRDAKEATLNQGDQAGSWGMHYRDKNTGRVLSFVEWPYFTTTGTFADNINPATGVTERAPLRVSDTNPNGPDVSHHPDQALVPYLVTGDVYYLEELQFWAQYCVIAQMANATYRNGPAGLVRREQLRGQAWALRSLAHAAYISPAGKEKTEFTRILQSNINWYDANYTNNTGDGGKLGIIHHGYSLNYEVVAGQGVTGMANWQDDHFTAAVGRAVELGFEFAKPLFNYKAKYTVGRLYGQAGVCWIQAAAYVNRVRDSDSSPIYTTHLQCYQNTMSPAVIAAAQASNCATPEMAAAWTGFNAWAAANGRPGSYMDGVSNPSVGDMDGYSDGDAGYPSCLQQAIAYCATHGAPNGANAWDVFEGRTVKPNYGSSPQFAIVPRAQEEAAVTAPADNYQVASGQTMYIGRAAPPTVQAFDSVTVVRAVDGPPDASDNGDILVLELHGSGGSNSFIGRQYRAAVSGLMAFGTEVEFGFSVAKSPAYVNVVVLRPIDLYSGRQSMHIGFVNIGGDPTVRLVTERRYDTMMAWAKTNLAMFNYTKTCVTGGSMGGWGSISYGMRRPDKFAAVYPDRPRWRYGYRIGEVAVSDYDGNGIGAVTVANSPNLSAADGGGKYAAYVDMISYVANTANKVPPVLWCCGRNDGFVQFSDQCDAVDALRAGKRAFAFAWNDGDHGTGSIPSQLLQSYPYGTYEIGKGYPLFTEHSGDKDPRVDLVGMINGGLTFKNVVETASGWSCEITNVLTACTVKVEPISDVFKSAVAKKTVTIPAASTWVPVTFNG